MEKELINSQLLVLNQMGYLVPISSKNILLKTGAIFLLIFVLIVSFMQHFYIQSGIFEIIDNVQWIIAVSQILSKVILIMFNKKKFLNLIELRDNFWNSKECSKNTQKEVDKILSTVIIVQKLFLWSLFVVFWLLLITMYATNRKLPAGSWSTIEYTKLYKVALPAYLLTYIFASFLSYCTEGIFLGFCYEIIIQFKILSDHLERMDVEQIESEEDLDNFYSQLKVYVEHHRFLCSYTNLFQDFYSSMFMVEYATSAPLICISVYATFESLNITTKLKFGVVCVVYVTQLCFYCIPLATISDEIEYVSTAIYNSNWYSKHYLKLKKATLLMIQQAQQEIRFTAWGLIDMNPPTLINVLQFAFSTSTFLRSLDYNKKIYYNMYQ